MSPVITPSTTYVIPHDYHAMGDDADDHYFYARLGNLSRKQLEASLAKLENGKFCSVFSSGKRKYANLL